MDGWLSMVRYQQRTWVRVICEGVSECGKREALNEYERVTM